MPKAPADRSHDWMPCASKMLRAHAYDICDVHLLRPYQNAMLFLTYCVCPIARRCVDECRPGTTLQHLHALSVRLLREGLRSLGLLSAMAPSHAHRPFYPHAVGAHHRADCIDAGMTNGLPLASKLI